MGIFKEAFYTNSFKSYMNEWMKNNPQGAYGKFTIIEIKKNTIFYRYRFYNLMDVPMTGWRDDCMDFKYIEGKNGNI